MQLLMFMTAYYVIRVYHHILKLRGKHCQTIPLLCYIGNEALSQWLEDPSSPSATLSWNTIHGELKMANYDICILLILCCNKSFFFILAGSGRIQQDIYMPSSYYVALANLNDEAVEVNLLMDTSNLS